MTDVGYSDHQVESPAPAPVAPTTETSSDTTTAAPTQSVVSRSLTQPSVFAYTVADSRIQRSAVSLAAPPPAAPSGTGSMRIQRSPAVGAAPLAISRDNQPRIRRAPGDNDNGLPKLAPVLTAAGFKSRSSVRGARRGKTLQQIDKWLAQAENASTMNERYYALTQATDACEIWVDKHKNDDKGGKRSVKSRRPHIKQLLRLLHQYPSPDAPDKAPDPGPKPKDDNGTQQLELVGGILDAVADSSGITGDYADINLATTSADNFNASDHSAMSSGGSGSINDMHADLAESANAITGIIGIAKGFHDIKEAEDGWEAAEAVGDTVASTGKMIHGAYKLTKGIALTQDADSTTYTQVGDIGAAYADGLGTIASFITWMKSIRDVHKKRTEQGGLTNQETAEATAEIASNTLNVMQGGTKTALDITKAVTQVGATEAIVALSTTAAAIGLVVGTIETARGGMQMYRGWSSKKKIANTRAAQEKFLTDFHMNIAEAMKTTSDQLMSGQIDLDEFGDLMEKWYELKDVYAELKDVVTESEGAFEALRKLQNRQMEQGAVKMAQGVTSIVSGALLLSGVGAPIAIGVAAVAGIIALSYAGVGLARNSAASGLIDLARRLSDDGTPKARPDDEPSYRLMTRRVENAYYNNLRAVLENREPFGFTEGEFRSIEQFVWDDKKDRLSGDDRKICADWSEFDSLTREQQKAAWIQVGQGDSAKKEKPKNWTKVTRKVRPSAHKSTQAMESNKLDVAEALWKLGSGSFDGQQFVPAPVTLSGSLDDIDDRNVVQEMKSATVAGLLDAADISVSRWKAWWHDSSEGDDVDRDKMIEHIVDHLR